MEMGKWIRMGVSVWGNTRMKKIEKAFMNVM